MSLWHLVIREIGYRKLNFALAAGSVLVAVGFLAGSLTILRAHDVRTKEIVAAKVSEVEAKVAGRQAEADRSAAELREAFRKIMLKFGYNLLILPADQPLIDYQVQGGPSATMDEAMVKRLSESKIMTVRHLLPVLQRKQVIVAGDQRREVFLVGTRGEVPVAHREPTQPLLPAVPPDKMILGHDVGAEMGVKVGGRVQVVDRTFEVIKVYPDRGNRDDSSVWIDLAAAQQLLGQPGRISGILALSCICTQAELGKIMEEIRRILPGTQVKVMRTEATIRYEARVRAEREARDNVKSAARVRADMKGQIESFAGWVGPLVLVAACVLTALASLVNVRQRRGEIGLWRALGLRSRKIFAIFLAKALLAGLAGAVVGYGIGFAAASAWPEAPAVARLFDPVVLAIVLLLAPLLSAAAGWVPAVLAARQDPAIVLQEE